MPVDLAG